MSTLIKDAGVWKEPEMIYVKDQGIWKEVGGGLPRAPGPLMGEPYGGGFVVNGYYYEVVNGTEILIRGGPGSDGYLYIIADKSSEQSLQWKTGDTNTPGTSSLTDGWANTNAMNNPTHPAAKYCRDYRGGGFDDWFLLAKDEIHLLWLNLVPSGENTPTIFKSGGPQALVAGFATYYWSSTQTTTVGNAWAEQMTAAGRQVNSKKTSEYIVRPARKILI